MSEMPTLEQMERVQSVWDNLHIDDASRKLTRTLMRELDLVESDIDAVSPGIALYTLEVAELVMRITLGMTEEQFAVLRGVPR